MHQEFEPPLALQDTIKCFWYNRMDFSKGYSGFEVMPDGYAEIIFHFGGSCSIEVNGALQLLPSPFLMGLLGHPAHFFAKNTFEIIGVRCYPWTVFDLLGLPTAKGVHLFEHPIAGLQQPLAAYINNGDITGAVNYLNHYFLNTRLQVSAGSLLHKAGAAMTKANGTLPVSGVAHAAHATTRTLERKFKESSGHTVKDVSALMRFEQVRNRLWHEPGVNLAGLAHELGYADQSHLSREFKKYSGTTPAAFARSKKEEPGFTNDLITFVQSINGSL